MSRRAIVLSVILHALLVVLLTVSVDFVPDKLIKPATTQSIVKATVVDQAAVTKEAERLAAADRKKQEAVREAERRARELEQKRKAEEQRVKELETRTERLKKEEQAAAQQKLETERKAATAKREAEEAERKRAEEQRKAAEQRKAEEAKRVAEEEKRKAEEAKRVAEEEKRKAEEARRQAAEEERKKQAEAAKEAERKRLEQALQDELEAEEAAAAQAQADSGEINRFAAAIKNRVRQSFTILPGLEGLSCTMRITLVPGGEVAGVQIVKSSGNATFDRQAENAVRKASPLPVPSDPRLFQQMRSISFVFDP